MRRYITFARAFALFVAAGTLAAQSGQKWVTAWTGSAQGPYPIGNVSAPMNLSSAFPDPNKGAHDQSFRLIVKPDIWGRQARIRLSNVLGGQPVTFDSIYAGVQLTAAALLPGTNHQITFGGKPGITIAPDRKSTRLNSSHT